MSLEQALAANTAALEKLTAAILAGGSNPAPAAEVPPKAPAKTPAPAEKVKAATTKPTAAQNAAAAQQPITPTVTQADIQAAGADLTTLAELDRAAAVAILGEFGVAKMTAAKPEQIPQIHSKVKAKLAELQGGAGASASLV